MIAGLAASIFSSFPPATFTENMLRINQPAAIAAMEGLFKGGIGAGIVLVGQPNEETGLIDNPSLSITC